MMRASDIFRLSLRNVLRGKARTLLTIFATAIGVFATALVLSIGLCARQTVADELDALGVSGVSIHPKKVASDAGFRLQPEDAAMVSAGVKGVDSALAVMIRYGSYSVRNWQGNALIFGVSDDLDGILSVELLHGRLINAADVRYSARVVVLDEEFAKSVFGRANIVGKTLHVTSGETCELEVVGVIRSQSAGIEALVGQSLPSFFYVPHSTLAAICGDDGTDQIIVSPSDDSVTSAAVRYLERIHGAPGSLKYDDISGIQGKIDHAMVLISAFIAAIGGISVLVAGIGIMNTMLSTTIERRREVGIYMSLGAKSRDIVLGFISEAGIISCIGALVGLAAAYGALVLIQRLSGFIMVLDVTYAAAAVAVVTFCGVLFGVAPAVRASHIDPIEALREN